MLGSELAFVNYYLILDHVPKYSISLRFRYRAVPIHDVATREKHMLGSELAFVNYYLILDHVPKYSIIQSLHLYNPFKLDAGISRN